MKKEPEPRILVFSTNSISDPGIDLAGSAHMHYSTSVQVIPLPCSSGVKPSWIVHALKQGFDGIFVAGCGGDCAFLHDCTPRTSALIKQEMGTEKGSQRPGLEAAGNLTLEQVKKIARMKGGSLLGADIKNRVLEVVGSCTSLGATVEGKEPKEMQRLINNGDYDAKLTE